uniref:Replication factor A C-terminal domain-containing protein n=1 Tax=Chenopodium quinoa TaxID=63459 RepID=A0A803KP39_CHEQI
MKPEYTPLDKLSPVSKAYKVRVTVKEKSPIRTPPNKKRFQKLVFEDEEGNSMKATLFGDECDHFKKVFEHRKKYEIANSPIRTINPKFSSFPGECELTFGGMTKIQAIDRTEGPILPEYIPITDVLKTIGPADRFDLLGIVVHMEEVRQVTYKSGRVADVRAISIVNERAHAQPDIIVGYMARQLEFMTAGTEPVPTTLDQIISKNVDNTVQEELYTLTVTIPDAQLSNVIAYIGCDNCGRRCGLAANVPFFCPHCPDKKCTSTERVNFTFDATDDTRTFRLTAFGTVCEQIFNLTTLEVFNRKIKDDWNDFDHLAAALKSTPMHIIVHPAQALNRVGVLRWVVQSVSRP